MCDSEWTSMKIQAQLETFDKLLDGDTKWRVKPVRESAFEVIDRAPPSSPPSPEITEGSKIKLDNKEGNPKLIEDQTKPPARYTQHGLVCSDEIREYWSPFYICRNY